MTTLPIEDFVWFLSEIRGTRYYCPYCGHDAFTFVPADEVDERGTTAEFAPLSAVNGIDKDFYGVCCTKCGNTVFFSGAVVRAGLAKRPHVKGDH
ncbi:MAG TPA: hypothetical protein VEU53_09845 [Stellaceae bacterium]|nr:hypothetical protein [Stellaceae bacterium]